MLVETDLFGTRDKVAEAIERLRFYEGLALRLDPEKGYFVADGGGKDSGVIVELCKMAGVKFEAHFHRTTLDPPELIRFLREHRPETILDRTAKTIVQLVRDNGTPPSRWRRYCCSTLKETGGKGKLVVTGVRWAESNRRKGRALIETCKRPETGKTILNPIVDWSTEEVWEFHRKYNVPYCSLYDEGFDRVGCVGCPVAGSKFQKVQFKRWPGFEKLWRRAFAAMLEKRAVDIATYDGPFPKWDTVDAVWAWWLGDQRNEEPEEPGLFD